MAAKRAETEALRFSGPPDDLTALHRFSGTPPTTVRVRLELPSPGDREEAGAPLTAAVERVGDRGFARLSLAVPASTAPGTYLGAAVLEGEERRVVADVRPSPELEVFPDALTLTAAPGAKVRVELDLINVGNVSLGIESTYAFGIYDEDGVESAFRRTYFAEEKESTGGADRLVQELASGHGGLVRVRVDEGAGELEVGGAARLRTSLSFSDRLTPEHTYSGTWPIHDLRYYVAVRVAPAGPEQRGHAR